MTRHVFLGGLLLAVASSLAQAQTLAKEKESLSAGLATKVKEIAADLKEARELLVKVADKPTRDRLELLITRSELRAVELEKSLAGVTPAASAPPLSAEDFAKLMKSLKAESFDEG